MKKKKLSFFQIYEKRKMYANFATQALQRKFFAKDVIIIDNRVAHYKNVTEQELRTIINYLRYRNTKTVQNGLVSTPVEHNKVKVHTHYYY